jgi:hypothetical protein
LVQPWKQVPKTDLQPQNSSEGKAKTWRSGEKERSLANACIRILDLSCKH